MQNILDLQRFETAAFDAVCPSNFSGCISDLSYVDTSLE